MRLDDAPGAQEAAAEVARLARTTVAPEDRDALDRAVRDATDLLDR